MIYKANFSPPRFYSESLLTKIFQDNGLKAKELTHDQILKKIGFKATAEYVSIVKKEVKSRYSKDLYNDTADKEGNKFHVSFSWCFTYI